MGVSPQRRLWVVTHQKSRDNRCNALLQTTAGKRVAACIKDLVLNARALQYLPEHTLLKLVVVDGKSGG